MIMTARWGLQSLLSPVERDPHLAICARLGFRLGRVKVWTLAEGFTDERMEYAHKSLTACAAFGLSLLAGRLKLTDETRHAITRLVGMVDEIFALDPDRREDLHDTFIELVNHLWFELKLEIEFNHGDECMRAFDAALTLLQVQMCFQAITGASRTKGSSLRRFLYSDDPHPMVADWLENLQSFCECQAHPPTIAAEIGRYASGFSDRSLSPSQILRLRSLLAGPWTEALQSYFSPIHGIDVGTLEPDLSIEELAAMCFSIGETCGAFELWMDPDDIYRARVKLKRLRLMLARAHLSVDLDSARLQVPVLDEGKPSPPPEVSDRAEYGYRVTNRLKEAVECLYGGVLLTVMVLARAIGSLVEVVDAGAESGDEADDELLLDTHFREFVTQSVDAIVTALDPRWMSPDLLKRAHREAGRWRRRNASPGQILELRDFLTGDFRDAVLREAVATLTADRGNAGSPAA